MRKADERIHDRDLGELWFEHMRHGRFEEAWLISDQQMRRRGGKVMSDLPRHQEAIWDGSPVDDRTVLLRCYHGLGDTIQFIRFTRPLRQRARKIIVWAQPELIPLLSTAPGVDQLIPLNDGVLDVEYDVELELSELMHLFRTTIDTIPADVPYLHAEPRLPSGSRDLNVGVVWQSGDWDDRRSIPLEGLRPLSAIPGVTLHALQDGDAYAEWDEELGPVSRGGDIVQTAQAIAALDLVITVDSMAAHLAGALGVPTWTLLHAEPDWRWMASGETTPWYPAMRLFRQRRAGEWAPVVWNVVAELRKLAAGKGAR